MATGGIGRRITWIVKVKLETTYTDFAKKLGTTKQLVSRWVNDPNQSPGTASIAKIARVTGVSRAWLQYGTGTPSGDPVGEVDIQSLQVALRQIIDVAREALGEIDASESDDHGEIRAEIDQNGTIVDTSIAWSGRINVPAHVMVGSQWSEYVHPDDQERVNWAITSVAERPNQTAEFQSRHVVAGGAEATVAWTAEKIGDHVRVRGEELDEPISDEVRFSSRPGQTG